MEARLVREELAKCWRTEGVNHYEVCHPLTEKYLDMLRTHRVSPCPVIRLRLALDCAQADLGDISRITDRGIPKARL